MIKLLKKCWVSFAILIITLAILSSIVRALTPWTEQYKGKLERHLSQLTGRPVTIQSMETGWYWFEPVLKLNQVVISDDKQHDFTLSKLLVGINVFSSLWHWQLQPGILYVDDVHLTIRQEDDHWKMDGLSDIKQTFTVNPTPYASVFSWLVAQEKIIIKNVSALVYLKDGSLLPLDKVNVTVLHRGGHYRIKGHAALSQTIPTELTLLADLKLDPYALKKASGHAYVSLQHVIPSQWQSILPSSSFHVDSGEGDIALWLDLRKGCIAGWQSRVHFENVNFQQAGKQSTNLVQLFAADLSWAREAAGWVLKANPVQLRVGDTIWPSNALQIRYDAVSEAHQLFVKNLLLEPIFTANIEWPAAFQSLVKLKPRGQLHNTQIEIKNHDIAYALTRFYNLGWQGHNKLPTGKGFDGALYWRPTEGRLQLDSENVVIKPMGLAPITLDLLNADFSWKQGDSLDVVMKQLAILHPNLELNVSGGLMHASAKSLGDIQLSGNFVSEDSHRWIPYLLALPLKPQFADWLQHGVKKITKASGHVTVKGPLEAFPFDKQPGDFSLVSQLSGVNLMFGKKWPLTKDIAGYLMLNKRNLEANVTHANLQGLIADKVHLRIDDMGLDHETLLVHSVVEAPAETLRKYVLKTPLKQRLSMLQRLSMTGLLGLDLNLEIPLYPENDDVIAQGSVNFSNNQVTVYHGVKGIALDKLTGLLHFDERGVTNSSLQTAIMGYPMGIQIKSVRQQQPYTEVTVEAETSIDVLRRELNIPVFSLMQGSLTVQGQLILTDDAQDMDHIQIKSSLKGVSIDLPQPLGKTADQEAPLVARIEFNPKTGLRLIADYNTTVRADLWFKGSDSSFLLEKGAILLGKGKASLLDQTGIQVVGTLPSFDFDKWHKTLSKLSNSGGENNITKVVRSVNVVLHEANVWGQRYQDLIIKANKVSSSAWKIAIQQSHVAADLNYDMPSNSLEGTFSHVYIQSSAPLRSKSKTPSSPALRLKPDQIPNLNLTINALKWNKIDLGKATFKSTSSPTAWRLNGCKIDTPAYRLSIQGQWKCSGDTQSTELQSRLEIHNLSKTLERWDLAPMVHANQGTVLLNAGWQGSISDFSLGKIVGQMNITLKDGRITNLDKETEEKLGLGKVLSILSLQTIPRRLKLNFSDLAHKGYSFDVFTGNFAIQQGIMSTKDSYIEGPVAYASMKGNLDLAKQSYDMELHISPHIAASLPIVATIAGGPVAGIAAWVASKIINKGMEKVSGYTYKVSGPWKNPEIKQLNIIKTT